MNHGHVAPAVAPLAAPVAPVEMTGVTSHPPGMNGSKNHEEEIRHISAPSMTGAYQAATVSQPSESAPVVAQPPKAATPAVEVPQSSEKIEEVEEPKPTKEVEPATVVEPAPTKRAERPEPTATTTSVGLMHFYFTLGLIIYLFFGLLGTF